MEKLIFSELLENKLLDMLWNKLIKIVVRERVGMRMKQRTVENQWENTPDGLNQTILS